MVDGGLFHIGQVILWMGDEFEEVEYQKCRIIVKPILSGFFPLIFYEGVLVTSLEYSQLYVIFITKLISSLDSI